MKRFGSAESLEYEQWLGGLGLRLLPEEPSRYFEMTPDTVLLPLQLLVPKRARKDGIVNANLHMLRAYTGQGAKQVPVSLTRHEDEHFVIPDGNSTYANAFVSSWKHLPCTSPDRHLERGNSVIHASAVSSQLESEAARSKILDRRRWCELGDRDVVLTKGSFDLLHAGHLALIAHCSKLRTRLEHGVLVVLVESDESVRRRKGDGRPIQDQVQRALQMALLANVDVVGITDYEDLEDAIRVLKPKCYVKGMDTAVPSDQSVCSDELILDLDSNAEMRALRDDCRVTVFTDDGRISTSRLLNKIRADPAR